MKRFAFAAPFLSLSLMWLAGCSSGRPPAQTMAPPVAQSAPMPTAAAPPTQGVYNWQEVPVGQEVPVHRAVFDQGGYQLYAASGETIVVPFANNNLYVMKFGRSNRGETYFVNEGSAPTLFLRNGGYLENAAAQGARWHPIPNEYHYTRPIYVGIAPSWRDYTAMGWYPGMVAYGGMWGYSPGVSFAWMPGFNISIGGARYNDYVSYRSYTRRNPGYARNRVVYNNYGARANRPFASSSGFSSTRNNSLRSSASGSFGSGRAFGSTSSGGGSFGSGSFRSSRTFGSSGGGAFGNSGSGRSFGGSGSAFGGSGSGGSSSGGAFGRSSSGGSSFGGSSGGGFRSGSRFGGGSSSGGFGGGSSSFSSPRSGSSFGGSTRSYGGGGGSFGSTRSGGSSFGSSSGGGRSGSSSFGGTRSSSSSFGSGRRR